MVAIRQRWDDSRIEGELRGVAEAMGRFPSTSDLRDMGRLDLTNQVERHGGFLHWARKLGIERRVSDSDKGWKGEDAAADRLARAGLAVTRRTGVKCHYDLLIEEVLRIDVKSARLTQYQHCREWFYRIGKYTQADLILLWQLDTGEFYLIPWFVCPSSNVTIATNGGKYARFRNNIEIIRSMATARQKETTLVTDAASSGTVHRPTL